MWSHLGQETFRWDVLKDSLRIARKPMLGWGLGAFETVYPAFRSFYTTVYDNAAHNDYVQVLVESGIVGFIFVVWFINLRIPHRVEELAPLESKLARRSSAVWDRRLHRPTGS